MKHKFYKELAVITFLVAILTSLTPGVALADTVPYEDQEVFNGMESTASIIETSAGTLLMVGQNEMTVDLQDPIKILVSFSTDGGYTWSTPVDLELPITGNTQMYRMPNLLKLASGRILLILNRRVTYGGGIPAVCYSDDDGETWSTPVKLTTEQDTKTYLMNDRARLLSSGRIVVPVARGFNESVEGVGTKVASYYSDDNGATWDRSGFVSYTTNLSKRGVQEPAVVELTNGDLLMVMRTGENYLYQSISTDEGEHGQHQ